MNVEIWKVIRMNNDGDLRNVSRREMIKSSSTIAALGGVSLPSISVVSAAESPYRLGERFFVEMKLEHDEVPEEPRSLGCGRPGYVSSKSDGIVSLISGRIWPEESSNLLIGNGETLFAPGKEMPGLRPGPNLLVDRPFQSGTTRSFLVDEPYSLEGPRLRRPREDMVIVDVDGEQIEVDAGSETEVELERKRVEYTPVADEMKAVEVTDPDDPDDTITTTVPVQKSAETTVVTPVLTVKVHGQVDVFGGSNVSILPLNSETPYAQRLTDVASLVDTEQNANELIVIEPDGENE